MPGTGGNQNQTLTTNNTGVLIMAKKNHSFKYSTKKAKAYKKAIKIILESCNELLIVEEKLCYHLMTGKAQNYVDNYKSERCLHAQKQLEQVKEF
jgi:hypothetical protein